MKIFKCLKSIFRQSNRNLDNSQIAKDFVDLPYDIANSENIARFIFSPINVNPKNNNLKSNCLKPPAGYDEISVNRYDFTNANFLKNVALEMQAPKKDFYGLAMFRAESIRESNFDIIYTPIENTNPFHSDIKIGYTVEKEVELPAEISAQIRNILKKTKLFKDTDSSTKDWVGEELKLE